MNKKQTNLKTCSSPQRADKRQLGEVRRGQPLPEVEEHIQAEPNVGHLVLEQAAREREHPH